MHRKHFHRDFNAAKGSRGGKWTLQGLEGGTIMILLSWLCLYSIEMSISVKN